MTTDISDIIRIVHGCYLIIPLVGILITTRVCSQYYYAFYKSRNNTIPDGSKLSWISSFLVLLGCLLQFSYVVYQLIMAESVYDYPGLSIWYMISFALLIQGRVLAVTRLLKTALKILQISNEISKKQFDLYTLTIRGSIYMATPMTYAIMTILLILPHYYPEKLSIFILFFSIGGMCVVFVCPGQTCMFGVWLLKAINDSKANSTLSAKHKQERADISRSIKWNLAFFAVFGVLVTLVASFLIIFQDWCQNNITVFLPVYIGVLTIGQIITSVQLKIPVHGNSHSSNAHQENTYLDSKASTRRNTVNKFVPASTSPGNPNNGKVKSTQVQPDSPLNTTEMIVVQPAANNTNTTVEVDETV